MRPLHTEGWYWFRSSPAPTSGARTDILEQGGAVVLVSILTRADVGCERDDASQSRNAVRVSILTRADVGCEMPLDGLNAPTNLFRSSPAPTSGARARGGSP